MAGRGPLPRMQHQRERDTRRRQSDVVTVTRDGVLRGPEIADATGRSDWSPAVLLWWETWRKAPQAQLFEDTDWSRLALLAPLLEAHVRRPSAAALSEIRLNEERLGALHVDRLRAKMRVEDPAEEPGLASVTEIPSARDDVAARLRGGSS